MPDATLKRLVELIENGNDPELRRAAVVVAGELRGIKAPSLQRGLLESLDHADLPVRLAAISTIGKLHVDAALPRLLELVQQHGPEVEAAAQAAGSLGARGVRGLEKVMTEASPVQRRRIAGALAHSGTEGAAVAAADALMDPDPGVAATAARSLAAETASFSPAQRRALATHLMSMLKPRRAKPLPEHAEAAVVRVLAALHEPRVEDLLWSRIGSEHPSTVRATALQALGSLPLPRAEAKLRALFACAADPDFQIAAPALVLLQKAPVTAKNTKDWLHLLEAPDLASRRMAVDKLKDSDNAAIARGLAAQLRHPDRMLRDAALAALSQSSSGRRALIEALLETESVDEAWMLARAQVSLDGELPSRSREQILRVACVYREKDDRRSEPLFFLLHERDAKWLAGQLEDRAAALRKKKDYAAALGYLRLLARDPACGEEIRFELAATGLKLSPHDLALEHRQADPCLGQFGRLLQNPDFKLIDHVRKAKWLEPAELYYLGFHFAEQNRQEKEFGGQVLEWLIKKSPRSNLAKDAKRKLRSEGLA